MQERYDHAAVEGSAQAAWQAANAFAADESARLGDAMNLYNETRRQGVTKVRLESQTRSAP